MEPTELYRQIFGIEEPWIVSEVRLDAEALELHVNVAHRGSNRLVCPECGTACAGYDHTPGCGDTSTPVSTKRWSTATFRAWSARSMAFA